MEMLNRLPNASNITALPKNASQKPAFCFMRFLEENLVL